MYGKKPTQILIFWFLFKATRIVEIEDPKSVHEMRKMKTMIMMISIWNILASDLRDVHSNVN